MSEQTATERLRELLDEYGVDYETEDRQTIRYTDWGDWIFSEPLYAKPHTLGAQCELMCIPATPEQAIAATLERGTCHIRVHDNLYESEGNGNIWLECDECHWQMDYAEAPSMPLYFCPNCGRKVIE